MMFYETSAKTAKQVDVAFGTLSKKLMEKRYFQEGVRVFFKEFQGQGNRDEKEGQKEKNRGKKEIKWKGKPC